MVGLTRSTVCQLYVHITLRRKEEVGSGVTVLLVTFLCSCIVLHTYILLKFPNNHCTGTVHFVHMEIKYVCNNTRCLHALKLKLMNTASCKLSQKKFHDLVSNQKFCGYNFAILFKINLVPFSREHFTK